MKVATTLVGASAIFAGADAFVPVAPVVGSARAGSVVVASPVVVAAPSTRAGHMAMLLGGSNKKGTPKSLSSKITNIFRGSRSKGYVTGP